MGTRQNYTWAGMRCVKATDVLFAVVILSLACALVFYNLDFPLGFHPDEPKKVRFVVKDTHDFLHPGLMIRLANALSFALGAENAQEVVYAGRAVSAIATLVMVFCAFVLARFFMPIEWAALATSAIALTPLTIVHSHYFKEDACLIAAQMFALFALAIWRNKPTTVRLICLAFSLGALVSTKYVGFVSAAVILLAAWAIQPRPRQDLIGFTVKFFFLPVGFVFFFATLGLKFDLASMYYGIRYEVNHVIDGHFGVDPGWLPLSYYKIALEPGLTLFLLILLTMGFFIACARWRRQPAILKTVSTIIVVHAICLTVISSIIDARYILPVTTLLPLPAVWGWYSLTQGQPSTYRSFLVCCFFVGIAHAGWSSYALLSKLSPTEDTRIQALNWIRAHGGTYARDYYFEYGGLAERLRCENNRIVTTADFLIAESTFYTRFFNYNKPMEGCVAAYRHFYDKIWRSQFVEFKPSGVEQFTYIAPTIRIVPLSERGRALMSADD